MVDARRIPADSSDARALVDAMFAELLVTYIEDLPAPVAPTLAEMSPPDGGFVALYDGEAAVAGGGLRRHAPGVCEIKRMYVIPARRSQGLARQLLDALEDMGRELGYARVRLDTGPLQPHAQALYEKTGYAPIGNYNDNAYASYWGEKVL